MRSYKTSPLLWTSLIRLHWRSAPLIGHAGPILWAVITIVPSGCSTSPKAYGVAGWYPFMQTFHSWAAVLTATYKATLSPERELLLLNLAWPEKSLDHPTEMDSSCSTSLLAPLLSMKIVPYIAEDSCLGGATSKDDLNWFYADNFLMLDSIASRSLDLRQASRTELTRNCRYSWWSCVAKTNLALNGLFNGSGLENGYHAADSTEGHCAGQDNDLDAASMCALSMEGMEGIYYKALLPVEDELLFDIDVTSAFLLTRKRHGFHLLAL
ncbi:uncharacterized protein BDR25DRAFT_348718 [Lindgomyces ingoldianus]|uniref:Uncharacterized protein n=1 Tax=Lindgomyces ingoldianus TaxID=673940 RepID=A0ACB6RC03_9PLEO|nr:uncharacterized protein BDR25DRAFT_348718 [Lindgomyces ingoldianus]KAF2476804.1 hypothetical protein BDR25DRAFT_348718 [Lindgomyces ingoldianus]